MKKIDEYIYYFFIIISLVGSIFIYSASSIIAILNYKNEFLFFKKQIIAITLSIFITYIISRIPIKIIKKHFKVIYIIIIITNILPFLPFFKNPINGANRWVKIYSILFQPSEVLKSGYFLYISNIFSIYKDQKHYLLLLIFSNFFITCLILSKQSDFGLIFIFSIITFILLQKYIYNKKNILYFIGLTSIILSFLIIKKPYRIERLITFLNPWKDPLGKGFQIIQSLVAIYSGGSFGLGLGNSQQKNIFLPMAHTDFIFSVITEEIGYIGSILLVIILLLYSYIFIHESYKKEDYFDKNFLFCSGLLIFLQTIINTGASTALLPTKGIGLPFISYGGSSLIGFSILIGISLSIIKQNTKKYV